MWTLGYSQFVFVTEFQDWILSPSISQTIFANTFIFSCLIFFYDPFTAIPHISKYDWATWAWWKVTLPTAGVGMKWSLGLFQNYSVILQYLFFLIDLLHYLPCLLLIFNLIICIFNLSITVISKPWSKNSFSFCVKLLKLRNKNSTIISYENECENTMFQVTEEMLRKLSTLLF